jgi:hypothetical protein
LKTAGSRFDHAKDRCPAFPPPLTVPKTWLCEPWRKDQRAQHRIQKTTKHILLFIRIITFRDVAKDSNIQAALVGYHYGTKLDLFNAVVSRRSVVINEARSQALVIALITKKKANLYLSKH